MSALIWGLVAGLVVGMVPVVMGASKDRLGLGIAGFFACAVSGAILGLLLAGPVCGYFVWRIANETRTPVETGTRPDAFASPIAIELAFWQSIQNSANPADFQAYINRYPEGQFSDIARNRLKSFIG